MKKRWWKHIPEESVYQLSDGEIVCIDALKCLKCLKEESVDIVFLDPPFNLGKKYGSSKNNDRLENKEYVEYLKNVLRRSAEVLKDGGALFLYHIPKYAVLFAHFLNEHLTFRHWIAITMKAGFVRPKHLYPAHYALLYYTKGKPGIFQRPKIKPPTCRTCHTFLRDYGGYKKFVENGINLSDVWDDISPVRHKKYKNRVANELPPKIPERVVHISGRSGAILVDPFAGSGTALVAARNRHMRFIGCDIEQEYCDLMFKRLSK